MNNDVRLERVSKLEAMGEKMLPLKDINIERVRWTSEILHLQEEHKAG